MQMICAQCHQDKTGMSVKIYYGKITGEKDYWDGNFLKRRTSYAINDEQVHICNDCLAKKTNSKKLINTITGLIISSFFLLFIGYISFTEKDGIFLMIIPAIFIPLMLFGLRRQIHPNMVRQEMAVILSKAKYYPMGFTEVMSQSGYDALKDGADFYHY
jgi:hypothetical protein